jgi:uncharacterized protein (DUF433 family)
MALTRPVVAEDVGEELLARYIEILPNRPDPGDARLSGYGYPVWIVIDALAAVGYDLEQVAREYELPEDAVRAALLFYRRHQAAVDARARENAAVYGAVS